MKKNAGPLIILLVVAGFAVIAYLAIQASTPSVTHGSATNTTAVASADCTAPGTTTAIGSVEYPIAPAYQNLRGLGMLFTAKDCGEARFAEVAKAIDYGSTGGRLILKTAPTVAFRTALTRLGFSCEKGNATTCTTWTIGKKAVSANDLLTLKPFINEIDKEDCASCG